VPTGNADEESMGSNVGPGGVEVEGMVFDIPVVSVVDTEAMKTMELDDDEEGVGVSGIWAGGLGSGDSTEAWIELEVVEDAEPLFVVEIDTVELLLDEVVVVALRVVVIETSLFVTAAAFTAELPIVIVGVTRIVVVEVLARPGYPHHL
jgi:hypothetical protein